MRFVVVLALLCATARADGPRLLSPSAIAIDAGSGDVLFARRADEVRPIASMTKLFGAGPAREEARPREVDHDHPRRCHRRDRRRPDDPARGPR